MSSFWEGRRLNWCNHSGDVQPLAIDVRDKLGQEEILPPKGHFMDAYYHPKPHPAADANKATSHLCSSTMLEISSQKRVEGGGTAADHCAK